MASSCPFVDTTTVNGSCYLKCPDGFVDGENNTCVSSIDSSVKVSRSGLQPFPMGGGVTVGANGMPTVAPVHMYSRYGQAKDDYPDLYNAYKDESERFEAAIAAAKTKLDKEAQVAKAFEDLQAAENVSDKYPDAYQKARTNYYTLLKGPEWAETELTRVAQTEAGPVVQSYSEQYRTVMGQFNQQKSVMELIQNAKDKVFGVQDDLQHATTTFGKQISDMQNQINMNNAAHQQQVASVSWFSWFINMLLIVLLVAVVVLLIRRSFVRPSVYQVVYR